MAILSEQAIDFAREHISKFYDSDFFPKAFEFEALWHSWEEVKKELLSKNVSKFQLTLPHALTVLKPKGGYRVVHQLDPMEALIYTALAFEVAGSVEACRPKPEAGIACSYRIKIADGSFFDGGSGWDDFRTKSEQLSKAHKYALVTDISDFYNQIYLHRLQNAIEAADAKLKPMSVEIESFITTLNNKASQGVPVGPAASIIMAEAVMMDVDSFIEQCGVSHTRYVDDIRMFGESARELESALEALTLYLYENHRLTLATDKTELLTAASFTEKYLHNQYIEDKDELLDSLETFGPYGSFEDFDWDAEIDDLGEEDEVASSLIAAFDKLLKLDHIDVGIARSIIRTARRHDVDDLAGMLLENFDFFAPVTPDVFIYLLEVTDDALAMDLCPAVSALCSADVARCSLVKYWLEFFIATQPRFLSVPKLKGFVFQGSNMEHKALAAITSKDLAWVRSQKANIYNVGSRARRAIIHSSKVLPSDERNNWLKLVIQNSVSPLERWVASWVMASVSGKKAPA
ncbi:reverse transcriptase domain-containing protein [Frateuria hangzhouensis]|uniref:reverse transcriptase domain-containing protein n=1 Tax=Frateuria hangzhouensis TaxID=2995589 RepID=UPI0022608319|nr:reverse transcriptase domain-containing protein [Frateuria sp. STR12]MCX7515181.1 reverse transcriptase domain-containing protein [Frateuria sp. STR12]